MSSTVSQPLFGHLQHLDKHAHHRYKHPHLINQPGLHYNHHFNFDSHDSSSPFFSSSSSSPSFSSHSSHRDPSDSSSSLGPIMDPSQFGDFSFSYGPQTHANGSTHDQRQYGQQHQHQHQQHQQHLHHHHIHHPQHLSPGQSSVAVAATTTATPSTSSTTTTTTTTAATTTNSSSSTTTGFYDDPHGSGADHFSLSSSAQTPNITNSAHPATSSTYAMDSSDYGNLDGGGGGVDDGFADHHSPEDNSVSVADDFGGATHGDRADGTDLGGKGGIKDDRGDNAPAWSELKTKAGKDRKRLPLACIACRRKKIRCSGEKPACKHCLRSHIPCVYKVTSRKAAPRTDYMAMLDKRLKRMEERIIKIVPKAEQDVGATTPPITRAVVKPAIPGPASGSKAGSKKRRAEEAFSPGFDAWVNAGPKSKPITQDNQNGGPESLAAHEVDDTSLSKEGLEALPPKDVQEHLSEVFFDCVYGQPYYLLHKPSYMRKLKNNQLPPVLVLSVCAVAARFSTNPKIATNARAFLRGEEWASHAREICTKRYEWPNLTILTCLVLLCIHEFGTCHGGRSWALGGQAIRMAYALQLHKDLDYDPQARGPKVKLSFIDREIRRRAMWSCFLMDRFTSGGSDRPMFIKEESIEVPLPVNERFFELDMPMQSEYLDGTVCSNTDASPADGTNGDSPTNLGVAAYMVRALAIWGRVLVYVNQGGRQLDPEPLWSEQSRFALLSRQNEMLLKTLPAHLQWTRENLDMHITEKTISQFLLLHVSIPLTSVFLHQSCVSILQSSTPNHDIPQDFIPKLTARTFAAASRISQVLRDGDELQSFAFAPFAGYCAFSSTSVQLLAMVSASPQIKAVAEANCSVNVKYLRKLMRHWGMFHWMVEDIRRQYKNNHEIARKGNAATTPAAPLLQYADWFNQYPYGIADSDFMDPSIGRKREKGEDAVLELKPELQSVEEFFTTLSPTPQGPEATKQPTAASKRKASTKKQVSVAIPRPDQQQHSDAKGNFSAADSAKRRASEQTTSHSSSQQGISSSSSNAATAAQQRRFSTPQGNQSTMTQQQQQQHQQQHSQLTFNQPSMPPQTQAYMSMSPTIPQYQSQAMNNMNYFNDMMPMSMSPQDTSMAQPLFPLPPGGMTPGMDGGNGSGWHSMDGRQPRAPGNQQQQQTLSMSGGVLNHNMFAGPADPSSWFIPYDVEAPDMSQDVLMTPTGAAASNMETFDNMFAPVNGSVSGNANSQGMAVHNHFPNM